MQKFPSEAEYNVVEKHFDVLWKAFPLSLAILQLIFAVGKIFAWPLFANLTWLQVLFPIWITGWQIVTLLIWAAWSAARFETDYNRERK